MFVEEGDTGANYLKEDPQSKESTPPKGSENKRRKFKPVLKSKSYLNQDGIGSSSQSPSRHHNPQQNRNLTNSKQIGLDIANVSSDKHTNQSNAAVQHVIQSRSGIGMLDEIQIATTGR